MKDFMLEVQFLEGAVAVTRHEDGRPVALVDEAYDNHEGFKIDAARLAIARLTESAPTEENRKSFEHAYPMPDFVSWQDGEYRCRTRRHCREFLMYCARWDAWQASRQTLSIKLPWYDSYDCYLQHETVEQCREVLAAAGVNAEVKL